MTETDVTPDVLTVTEVAIERILELRAQEEGPEALGLRIEVTGQRASNTPTT